MRERAAKNEENREKLESEIVGEMVETMGRGRKKLSGREGVEVRSRGKREIEK